MDDGFFGLATIAVAGSALGIFLPAKVLSYFVALKSRPLKRSIMTISVPYVLLSTFIMTWQIVSDFWYLIPLVTLPGALIAFWLNYSSLRNRWVDDAENLPEGVDLATEDWKEGIAMLALTALISAAIVALRLLLQSASN